MRRVVSVLLASTFLIALAAPVAGAATPIDERRVRTSLELETFTIPADPEFTCAFDVLLEDFDGRVTHVFITEDRHGNVLERVIYHTNTRYTNVSTGDSFERRFDSVVNITTWADGSGRVITRNDALFIGGEPSSVAAGSTSSTTGAPSTSSTRKATSSSRRSSQPTRSSTCARS